MQSTVRSHPEKLSALGGAERKRLLWVRRADIEHYRELPSANARLCRLMDMALENGNELMIWVPPSLPYYSLQGAYKGKKRFSKVLVFSAWEMVPRMIATQLSYEAERKTVGKLITQTGEKTGACNYFAKARFPYPRLRFRTDEGAETMSLFALIYPSQTLADNYRPIDCLNRKLSLAQIEREVREALRSKLNDLCVSGQPGGRADARWYYLAPMLLDGADKALEWARTLVDADEEPDEDEGGQGSGAFLQHLETLCGELEATEPLGRQPEDLLDVLVAMVVGSPAVCALRANDGLAQEATQFARAMLNKFNAQEATAAVELVYGKRSDDAHWKNVLRYFCDGCFQAVLDEYAHMLTESHNLKAAPDRYPQLNALLLDGAGLRTVSHPVDTFESFRSRVKGAQGKEKAMRIRSHYAVGFYAGEKTGEGIARKENVRNAFNSPFRPFVLATTSIGQEGLDFHFYCRKIMHWNLPSNPIDLEQREGRINRFKCLAIRQNLAERYGTKAFEEDVWDELFATAKESANGSASSELVPFWCLNDEQEVKIERIVPMYPLSRDLGSYERLIKILSLYRLTLGQPRQEEFLEYVMQRELPNEIIKELFINLSPHYRVNKSIIEA